MGDAVFRYRLQPLLDQRIASKDEAQRALAERLKEQREAQDHQLELKTAEARLNEKFQANRRGLLAGASDSPLPVSELQDRVSDMKAIEYDLEQARDAEFSQRIVVEERGEAVSAAREELAARTRDVEVLKKHRQRSLERFQREVERKEALEQDEIGSMLHSARKQGI